MVRIWLRHPLTDLGLTPGDRVRSNLDLSRECTLPHSSINRVPAQAREVKDFFKPQETINTHRFCHFINPRLAYAFGLRDLSTLCRLHISTSDFTQATACALSFTCFGKSLLLDIRYRGGAQPCDPPHFGQGDRLGRYFFRFGIHPLGQNS